MEIHKALNQISEIHGHLAKAEIYKSYKSFPIALSGILAIGVALVQPKWIGPEAPLGFVALWTATAAVCLVMSGGVILYNYVCIEGPVARRTTRRVVGQFVPALLAGALVSTVAALAGTREVVAVLPGAWAVLYGMGIFSCRPYLPRTVGWVALFYLLAGAVLLRLAFDQSSLSPWGMGVTFGVGQLLAAAVLYWNLERVDG